MIVAFEIYTTVCIDPILFEQIPFLLRDVIVHGRPPRNFQVRGNDFAIKF